MPRLNLYSKKYTNKYTLLDDEDYKKLNGQKLCFTNVGKGYAIIQDANTKQRINLHRFIMNTPTGMDTDHINGDTLDNRRQNLRICTHQQNIANRQKQRNPTSSKYKGVSWGKKE